MNSVGMQMLYTEEHMSWLLKLSNINENFIKIGIWFGIILSLQ
jgi:hypothetical protein